MLGPCAGVGTGKAVAEGTLGGMETVGEAGGTFFLWLLLGDGDWPRGLTLPKKPRDCNEKAPCQWGGKKEESKTMWF